METIKNEQLVVVSAYQRLFSTEDGQKVLTDLAKSSGFLASSMGDTPHETAFNEGARSVFLRIVTTVGTDMDYLIKLAEKELNNHEQEEF